MKKSQLLLVLLALTISFCLKANSTYYLFNPNKNKKFESNTAVPYLKNNSSICPVKVYEKDHYSLYKCHSNHFRNAPHYSLKVNNYNYFVYKNEKFSFIVTNYNKDVVYKFFTTEQSEKIDSLIVNYTK
jgi:hypothetical protein